MNDINEPYAGIVCVQSGIDGIAPCGKVDLSQGQYNRQMSAENSTWFCPNCGGYAVFDDGRFEQLQEKIFATEEQYR